MQGPLIAPDHKKGRADLLGGPIDWLLTVGIGLAGTIGGAMTAYVALSLLLPRALHHAR